MNRHRFPVLTFDSSTAESKTESSSCKDNLKSVKSWLTKSLRYYSVANGEISHDTPMTLKPEKKCKCCCGKTDRPVRIELPKRNTSSLTNYVERWKRKGMTNENIDLETVSHHEVAKKRNVETNTRKKENFDKHTQFEYACETTKPSRVNRSTSVNSRAVTASSSVGSSIKFGLIICDSNCGKKRTASSSCQYESCTRDNANSLYSLPGRSADRCAVQKHANVQTDCDNIQKSNITRSAQTQPAQTKEKPRGCKILQFIVSLIECLLCSFIIMLCFPLAILISIYWFISCIWKSRAMKIKCFASNLQRRNLDRQKYGVRSLLERNAEKLCSDRRHRNKTSAPKCSCSSRIPKRSNIISGCCTPQQSAAFCSKNCMGLSANSLTPPLERVIAKRSFGYTAPVNPTDSLVKSLFIGHNKTYQNFNVRVHNFKQNSPVLSVKDQITKREIIPDRKRKYMLYHNMRRRRAKPLHSCRSRCHGNKRQLIIERQGIKPVFAYFSAVHEYRRDQCYHKCNCSIANIEKKTCSKSSPQNACHKNSRMHEYRRDEWDHKCNCRIANIKKTEPCWDEKYENPTVLQKYEGLSLTISRPKCHGYRISSFEENYERPNVSRPVRAAYTNPYSRKYEITTASRPKYYGYKIPSFEEDYENLNISRPVRDKGTNPRSRKELVDYFNYVKKCRKKRRKHQKCNCGGCRCSICRAIESCITKVNNNCECDDRHKDYTCCCTAPYCTYLECCRACKSCSRCCFIAATAVLWCPLYVLVLCLQDLCLL